MWLVAGKKFKVKDEKASPSVSTSSEDNVDASSEVSLVDLGA